MALPDFSPSPSFIERVTSTGRSAVALSSLRSDMVVRVATAPFAPSWATQLAAGGVLAAERVTIP